MLFDIPTFEMPFPARMHPLVDRIRERTRTWVRDKGFLGLGIWDEASFEAADYGLFLALAYPEAAPDRLDLLTDWLSWGWFADDAVEPIKRGRNPVVLKAFVERIRALTPVDGSTPPAPVGPVEEALADLWARSVAQMPEETLRLLPEALDDFIGGTMWELHNDIQGRVPDPVDYVEMRRKTAAAALTSIVGEWAVSGAALPPKARENRLVRELLEIAGDVQGLHNDIVSFEKDVVGEGTINNGLLAVRNFFGGELSDAVRVVNDLISARLRQFQGTTKELPEYAHYARLLQFWLAGYFLWAERTGRYRVPETNPAVERMATFHRPSGLGTAAVLVR